jgi:hypothetical protein
MPSPDVELHRRVYPTGCGVPSCPICYPGDPASETVPDQQPATDLGVDTGYDAGNRGQAP